MATASTSSGRRWRRPGSCGDGLALGGVAAIAHGHGPGTLSSARSRLALLLGEDLERIGPTHIDLLVQGATREDVDLDFKEELYGRGDSDKRSLAGDAAALANTVGGALILGVAETDGAASGAPGVPLSEDEELRIRLIVASNVAPPCRFHLHRIERSQGHGFYVLEVPRSPEAPHAVRKDESLRYPRRDGTTTRWMSEAEVADAYASRFRSAESRLRRLDQVHADGIAALARNGWAGDVAWITLAAVPELPGELELTQNTPRRLAAELRDRSHAINGHESRLADHDARATTGTRRVVINQGVYGDDGKPMVSHWQFHTDGSAFAALAVGFVRTQQGPNGAREVTDPRRFAVDDEDVVISTAQGLDVLADHALNRCHAGGAALLRSSLESRDPHGRSCLTSLTSDRGRSIRQSPEPESADLPVVDHSVDLLAVAASAVELMVTTRIVVTDFMQALGRPECWQIDRDGRLRPFFFQSQVAERHVVPWATRAGVELTDERPG